MGDEWAGQDAEKKWESARSVPGWKTLKGRTRGNSSAGSPSLRALPVSQLWSSTSRCRGLGASRLVDEQPLLCSDSVERLPRPHTQELLGTHRRNPLNGVDNTHQPCRATPGLNPLAPG